MFKEYFAIDFRSIGSNLIYVSVADRQGALPGTWLDEIQEKAEITAFSEMVSGQTSYLVDGSNVDVSISGVNQFYGFVSSLDMTDGRFLNEFDVNNNLTVVGIVEPRGTNFSGDNDMMIYIPIDYARTMFPMGGRFKTYYITAASEENIDLTMNRITTYLAKYLPSENQYRIFSQSQILGVLDTLMALLTTLLSGIASISLIVGGIGIMNIMLVTVRERTREIGIRKALGARRQQILIQFLIEAVIITTLGGIFGLIISYIGAQIITSVTDFNVVLGWDAVLLSLVFSITIGVIFGIYPAMQASKLEPVEALRFE